MTPAVIIPTCERPNSLRLASISALKALPSDGVLIVVDDGIRHSAKLALSQFDDARLTIVSTTGSRGPSAARNLGAQSTTADVLFFLDDDDAMVTGYIEKSLRVLRTEKQDIDFGFSAAFWDHSVIGRKKPAGRIHSNGSLENRIAGLGMGFWIKREVFHSIGGLNENIRINEDTDLCLRLAKAKINGWYSDEPGVRLCSTLGGRNEQPSLSETTAPADRLVVFEGFLEQHGDLLDQNKKLRKKFAFRVVKYRARCEGVWQAFQKSKHLFPIRSRAALLVAALFWGTAHRVRSRIA